MNMSLSDDWYVKIGPNRAGPYSPEQILSLLDDGEIQPSNKVSCLELKGQWISVEELVTKYRVHQAETAKKAAVEKAAQRARMAAYTSSFTPPIRPEDIDKVPSARPDIDPSRDATLSLFDTIQAVKERKTTIASRIIVAPPEQKGGLWGRLQRFVPSQAWLIVCLTLVLVLFAWGLMKMVEKNLKPVASAPGAKPTIGAGTAGAGTTGPGVTTGAPPPPGSLKPPGPVHQKPPTLPALPKITISAPKHGSPARIPPPPRPPAGPPQPSQADINRGNDQPDPRDEPPPPQEDQRQENMPPPPQPPPPGPPGEPPPPPDNHQGRPGDDRPPEPGQPL